MNSIIEITRLFPSSVSEKINWAELEASPLGRFLTTMSNTPQNPEYHAEGDVYEHTKMVCEELTRTERFWELPQKKRDILFLSALLHDVGKITCTRLEDGHWISPSHAHAGAFAVREFLWRERGLSGEYEAMNFRETVCTLIRYHSLPAYAILREDGGRALIKAASAGNVLPDFSLELLMMLSEADARGRKCADHDDYLERVLLGGELAIEMGCLLGPYPFANTHTGFTYMQGRNVAPYAELYDDTWGEVIVMSGLPGTGKDTFIKNCFAGLPMISLDDIRKELKISPTEPQGKVADQARKYARELLRNKTPFVWNATNITAMTRSRITDLVSSYGAASRIVYLETRWDELLSRNAGRKETVPALEIMKMLGKLTPPEMFEGHYVEWRCV